jgi:hypothetical protein
VTETRDRKEFGDALDEAHDDGLEVAKRGVHALTLNQGEFLFGPMRARD